MFYETKVAKQLKLFTLPFIALLIFNILLDTKSKKNHLLYFLLKHLINKSNKVTSK